MIWSEFAGRIYLEHFHQFPSRAMYPTLDGSYGTSDNCCRFFAGEASGCDEHKCFPLFWRHGIERAAKVLYIHMAVWDRTDAQCIGVLTIRIFTYVTPLATFREKRVALNGEERGPKMRAFLEVVETIPRFEQRVLHQIVGAIGITGK